MTTAAKHAGIIGDLRRNIRLAQNARVKILM
jgi:hypothetical protein